MTTFWSIWIIVLTSATIVLITWGLFATRKMRLIQDEHDEVHEYDGITEEDNPLPQWWLIMFVVTIIFGVLYLAMYPGMGRYQGVLDWSSAKQLEADGAYNVAKFEKNTESFKDLPFDALSDHPAAVKAGRRIFSSNCAVCHGSDASGGPGFANLSDAYWQWGHSEAALIETIAEGRTAVMPAWKEQLSEDEVNILVRYLSFQDRNPNSLQLSRPAREIAAQGQTLYSGNCAACHGQNLEGNPLMGAPSLVDTAWLYGNSSKAIAHSILEGRNGQMPAHKQILDQEQIRLVAAYLTSLSNKAKAQAESH